MALYLAIYTLIACLGAGALVNAQQPTQKGISQELFDRFSFFAEYAAGCHDGVDCGAGNCLNVTSANTTTIAEFNSTSLYNQGVSGFVLLDHTHELIVLQFVDPPGILEDLVQHQKNVTLAPVTKAMAQYRNYKIVFVGHSLGAALATVAAAEFRTYGHNVTLYSYASPSVGNYELSELISTQAQGETYRLAHCNDIIPRILCNGAGPPFFPDYSQLSPEY
ncbi:alpha/beta-hydrolase [Aspergillus violaceofuscus CBS 115571]|uniref:feruloyl esterase n=1 Tax=Aspergillus violaceofuscus (strain CBS 115571) TaxID=1450538 RepID=A0A2V5H0H8_ASPV1|nr:alpha/beta-hydrolase [Aspergillus violaceofuscus CBS 115571]